MWKRLPLHWWLGARLRSTATTPLAQRLAQPTYTLSYRDIEEMMAERGVYLDHSTINRWVLRYSPLLCETVKARRRRTASSWRLDETYIKVKGQWKYLYRAVDKFNNTIDFLLTSRRDRDAALRFLAQAIEGAGLPDKINIDKSGANASAINTFNSWFDAEIEARQCKYLNNVIEQDHRWVRKVRSALGFKAFYSAYATLMGVEAVRMIHKGQLRAEFSRGLCSVEQFHAIVC